MWRHFGHREVIINASRCLGSLTYFTVVSPSTPLSLLALLDANTRLTARTVAEALLFNSPNLLLDASFENLTTAWLSAFSEETQVPLLILGSVAKTCGGNGTFNLGPTYEDMAWSCLGCSRSLW